MAYYIAPDAYGDDALWSDQPDPENPRLIATRRGRTDELWTLLTDGARALNNDGSQRAEAAEDVVDLIHADMGLCTYPGEISTDGTRCCYCGAELPDRLVLARRVQSVTAERDAARTVVKNLDNEIESGDLVSAHKVHNAENRAERAEDHVTELQAVIRRLKGQTNQETI